jgi:plasmid replication initiation protein
MTEEDLGYIGGKKNVPRTYEALKKLSKKIIHISYLNENNELVNGYIHWVDAFFYNTVTKRYDVRISPEILPYMINVKDHFTTLDIGEAMTFGSARSQKMYEFISMFSGDFRYSDKRSQRARLRIC